MVAEIKAKGSKSRRASGQTVRLRKRHWVLSGLKAENKNVGMLICLTSVLVKSRASSTLYRMALPHELHIGYR